MDYKDVNLEKFNNTLALFWPEIFYSVIPTPEFKLGINNDSFQFNT